MAKVSVFGCGLMGSSLARALHAAGSEVGGFDPDASRLAALEAEGIGARSSVAEGFAEADLVVISVPTYAHVRGILSEMESEENWSPTVVNLVTGTPSEARTTAATVLAHGASYLDGAIFNYPSEVGTEEAVVVFAGAEEAWTANRELLMSLGGGSVYVGGDVGAANVIDVSMAGAFYTAALGALAEAAAYVRSEGVDLRLALPAARREAEQLVADVGEALEAVASGDYSTDQASIDLFLEAAEAWTDAMTESKQRGALMAATTANLRRAHDAGHGKLGFFAQVEAIND